MKILTAIILASVLCLTQASVVFASQTKASCSPTNPHDCE